MGLKCCAGCHSGRQCCDSLCPSRQRWQCQAVCSPAHTWPILHRPWVLPTGNSFASVSFLPVDSKEENMRWS
jgi:hypothetical protein